MPTVNFTPTSDAPDTRTLAGYVPTGSAPSARTIAGFTRTGSAPAARTLSGYTPGTDAPDARTLDGYAPTGNAPAARTLSGYTPGSDAPDARTLPDYTATTDEPDRRSNGFGRATQEPPRAHNYTVPTATPTDLNVNTPILRFEGALVLNATRGQTRIPQASTLARVQAELQEAPVGDDAEFTLVDSDGNALAGAVITVSDGETFAELVLDEPLSLLAGANIRLKATKVGSTRAGGFATITLFTQLGS